MRWDFKIRMSFDDGDSSNLSSRLEAQAKNKKTTELGPYCEQHFETALWEKISINLFLLAKNYFLAFFRDG